MIQFFRGSTQLADAIAKGLESTGFHGEVARALAV